MRLSSLQFLLLACVAAASSAHERQAGARFPDTAPAFDPSHNLPPPDGQPGFGPSPYDDSPASSQQQAAVINAPPAQPLPPANPALADPPLPPPPPPPLPPYNQPPTIAPQANAPIPNAAAVYPDPAVLAPANAPPMPAQPPIDYTNQKDVKTPVSPPSVATPINPPPPAGYPAADSQHTSALSTEASTKVGEGVVPTMTSVPEMRPAIPNVFCSKVHELLSVANANSQAGQYCSSKLHLKTRPTITRTVSTTIMTTIISTYTTRTEVVTQLAQYIPKDVTLPMYVVTKTLRGVTTRRVSSTVFPTQYYSCLSGSAGKSMLESQAQVANTQVPKPSAFSPFTDDRDVISACGCLGLPSEPTATVTSAISSTSTVYSSEHEVATSTSYILPAGTSFSIRVPPTSTRLINSKSTVTHTHGLATNTAFALLGSNSKYARVDDTDMLHFSDDYTGPHSQVPTIFRLDPQTCALSIVDGAPFGLESFIAVETTNAGRSLAGGDSVRFEHPTAAEAGFSALLCHIEQPSQRLKCTVDGDTPNGGTMEKSQYWRLGPQSSEDFAIKAIPVDHGAKCLTHCRQQDNMLFLDGDQFVGQTVLQNCLAKCQKV